LPPPALLLPQPPLVLLPLLRVLLLHA